MQIEELLAELRINDAIRMKRIVDEDQLGYLSYRAFSAGFVAAVNYYGVTPGEYDGYDAGLKWSEWNDELWVTENDDAKIAAPELTEKDTVLRDAMMTWETETELRLIKDVLAQ